MSYTEDMHEHFLIYSNKCKNRERPAEAWTDNIGEWTKLEGSCLISSAPYRPYNHTAFRQKHKEPREPKLQTRCIKVHGLHLHLGKIWCQVQSSHKLLNKSTSVCTTEGEEHAKIGLKVVRN